MSGNHLRHEHGIGVSQDRPAVETARPPQGGVDLPGVIRRRPAAPASSCPGNAATTQGRPDRGKLSLAQRTGPTRGTPPVRFPGPHASACRDGTPETDQRIGPQLRDFRDRYAQGAARSESDLHRLLGKHDQKRQIEIIDGVRPASGRTAAIAPAQVEMKHVAARPALDLDLRGKCSIRQQHQPITGQPFRHPQQRDPVAHEQAVHKRLSGLSQQSRMAAEDSPGDIRFG